MSVYFARVGRYVKVGYSKNPERRVANLFKSTTRYGRPWDLSLNAERELLLVIEGDKNTERMCHQALDDYRAGGEFFIDEPGVREFMWRAEGGDIAPVTRPGGEFEPVPHTQMPPERRAEIDNMLRRDQLRRRAS